MPVQPTTLRRLRTLLENSDATTRVSEAFDTAHDLLDDESHAQTAPLHRALSLMVYSRAIRAAQLQAEPAELDRLVTVITKLEKPNSGQPGKPHRPVVIGQINHLAPPH